MKLSIEEEEVYEHFNADGEEDLYDTLHSTLMNACDVVGVELSINTIVVVRKFAKVYRKSNGTLHLDRGVLMAFPIEFVSSESRWECKSK
jgi:hypothetical protein